MRGKRTAGNYILAGMLSILAALAMTCSVSNDPLVISTEGLEELPAFARFLEVCMRSMSSDRITPLALAVVTAWSIVMVWKKSFQIRDKVTAGILALSFSGAQLLCGSYNDYDNWSELLGSGFSFGRSLVVILGTSVLFYHLILLLFDLIERTGQKETGREEKFPRKAFVRAALLIFLCWLPYLILFFPGTSSNDTASQIAQFFGYPTWTRNMSAVRGEDIYLSNHFPFLTTLVTGGFVRLGLLFGSASAGVALYSVVQMLFMAFTFSGIWFYLLSVGLSGRIVRAGLLFTALFPLYPMYAVCMLKDPLFGMLCLTTTVLLFEIVRSRGEALKKPVFGAVLFADCLLFMLSRSQGVYILAVTALILLIVYRRFWLPVVLSVILPLVLFQMLWIRILLPAWDVAPAGRQEMLGIFFQQTARYVKLYPEDVTEEEKEAISRVIRYDSLAEKYNSRLSDPVKFTFNQDCTGSDIRGYFKAWLSMFRKHPGVYAEAVLNNCYGFFYLRYPSGLVYVNFVNKSYWNEENGLRVSAPAWREGVSVTAQKLISFVQRIPVLNILFSVGIWPWVVIFFFFYTIRRKKYRYLTAGMIGVLSTGILLICPANGNFRYTMPLFYMAPFLVSMCLLYEKNDGKEVRGNGKK